MIKNTLINTMRNRGVLVEEYLNMTGLEIGMVFIFMTFKDSFNKWEPIGGYGWGKNLESYR